jgi:hypothetical protein
MALRPFKNAAARNKKTKRQSSSFIGDPMDIINIHKNNYVYYLDGAIVDYEKALRTVVKNQNWIVSMEMKANKTAMIINTFNKTVGPEIIEKRNC